MKAQNEANKRNFKEKENDKKAMTHKTLHLRFMLASHKNYNPVMCARIFRRISGKIKL